MSIHPCEQLAQVSTNHLDDFTTNTQTIPFIEPITTNEYTVKDSFSFAKEVVNFDSKLFMSSLDVTSLFTNIPLNETTNIICDELFKDKELISGMDKNVFRELLV